MKKTNWVDEMAQIAKDFEHADVKAFRFTKINGKVSCVVTVLNTEPSELVRWELVDDGVSTDRWRKTWSDDLTNAENSPADAALRPSEVRELFLSSLIR